MGPDGGSQNGNTPPPFLTKTYDMVDDPTTDEIVSWSGTGATFVVWNAADFSRDLLPQYFKHNNFSSFVRQLNTYGFRKINPDRWEFATEGFSRGNKDALKNIHRRKPSAASHYSSSQASASCHSSSQAHTVEHLQLQQLQPELVRCTDPAHSKLQEEVKKMQQDKKVLLVELTNLRQEQQTTEMDLQDLGQRLQVLEERQQQILSFLAQAVCNPGFLAQFVQQQTESMTFNKKRRLPCNQEVLVGTGESGDDDKHPVGSITAGKDMSGTWQNYSETISRANISCEGILRQLSISTLNQSDGNSPISHSSDVNLREIHTLTMYPDTPANDVSGQSVPEATVPQVRHARYSGEITGQSSQKGESGDNTVALDINVSNELEPLLPWAPQSSHKKTGKKAAKGSGSNDGFWEKYLTESPSSTDTESDLETDNIIKTKEVCLKDSFGKSRS